MKSITIYVKVKAIIRGDIGRLSVFCCDRRISSWIRSRGQTASDIAVIMQRRRRRQSRKNFRRYNKVIKPLIAFRVIAINIGDIL